MVGIIVELPFLTRPVCPPVMARLWHPKQGPSKVELTASMIRLLAVCHAQRTVHVVADAAYHGKALRELRSNVTFNTRLPANAALYDLAPPRTGRRGRPALKGTRLGTPAHLAAATFAKARVARYGRTDTGYDLALVTTDLHSSPAALITRYAWRWSAEVTFAESRDLLGVGLARNRTEHAVRRTVPFGLYCYSITVLWCALHGHHPSDAADRRERAPWYATKTQPAFSDMLAKLRRVIIAARFLPTSPGQPTDAEIRAVHQTWASASDDQAACPCLNVESRGKTPGQKSLQKSCTQWGCWMRRRAGLPLSTISAESAQ